MSGSVVVLTSALVQVIIFLVIVIIAVVIKTCSIVLWEELLLPPLCSRSASRYRRRRLTHDSDSSATEQWVIECTRRECVHGTTRCCYRHLPLEYRCRHVWDRWRHCITSLKQLKLLDCVLDCLFFEHVYDVWNQFL